MIDASSEEVMANSPSQGLPYLLLVILLVSVAGMYSYLKGVGISTDFVSNEITSSPQPTEKSNNDNIIPTKIVTISPTPEVTPIVVFESGGTISREDKYEINKKISDPLIDYYYDQNGKGYIIAVSIAKNSNDSDGSYPYSIKAIFRDGATYGTLIKKGTSGLDWWYPECVNSCSFSDSFKKKYPEIV